MPELGAYRVGTGVVAWPVLGEDAGEQFDRVGRAEYAQPDNDGMTVPSVGQASGDQHPASGDAVQERADVEGVLDVVQY